MNQTSSTAQIHLNAFTLACPSPQFWGAWKLPEDRSAEGFMDLNYWIEFAQLLERGKFDALFFADTIGVADVYGGDESAALRDGVFAPGIGEYLEVCYQLWEKSWDADALRIDRQAGVLADPDPGSPDQSSGRVLFGPGPSPSASVTPADALPV